MCTWSWLMELEQFIFVDLIKGLFQSFVKVSKIDKKILEFNKRHLKKAESYILQNVGHITIKMSTIV